MQNYTHTHTHILCVCVILLKYRGLHVIFQIWCLKTRSSQTRIRCVIYRWHFSFLHHVQSDLTHHYTANQNFAPIQKLPDSNPACFSFALPFVFCIIPYNNNNNTNTHHKKKKKKKSLNTLCLSFLSRAHNSINSTHLDMPYCRATLLLLGSSNSSFLFI